MHTAIPSPPQHTWLLFDRIPLRAYALCIIAGIFIALYIGGKRLAARGGQPSTLSDIAVWAVPFGIIGGRLYHVISSPDAYFGPNGDPIKALYIWQGGLGIWGAVALGALGVWIGCKQNKVDFWVVADSLAPAVAFAQAIGRVGNYFNQELFGRPTDLPWALKIDPPHRPIGYADEATYHPTFLYELVWNLGVGAFLIIVGNRLKWSHGQTFMAYIAAYTVGRFWIEAMRIDPAELILGVRLNVWVSGALFAFGIIGFWLATKRRERALTAHTVPVGIDPTLATAVAPWHGWDAPAEADESAESDASADEPGTSDDGADSDSAGSGGGDSSDGTSGDDDAGTTPQNGSTAKAATSDDVTSKATNGDAGTSDDCTTTGSAADDTTPGDTGETQRR